MSTELYSIIIAVSVLTISILVWYIIRRRRSQTASHFINTILKPHQRSEVKSIIIPDGIGGLIEIEHLVLLDQGILLIETYPMSGNLFGAEKIDQWTQIVDGRSYKFANPLRHIRTSRQAIKSLVPKVPVFCCVIFTSDSHFPKGKPDEVATLKSLSDDIIYIQNEPAMISLATSSWERVMRIARKDGQALHRQGAMDG